MKIKTTVVCLPVTEVQRALIFYREVFGFSEAKIEEGILTLEFPNLTLFIMEKNAYEAYARKAKREALFPGNSAPAIISCAVETKQDVDQALECAKKYGGTAPTKPAIDPSFGGYIGYIGDPEGHLWELVCPKPK